MNCLQCGNTITQNMKFCEKCGEIVDLAKIRSKEEKGFELSQGEVEVRTYHCTTLANPKAQGYVTITNKRVIYHGHGRTSFMHSEVHINKITGLRSYFGGGYNIKLLILGGILVVIGFYLMTGFFHYKLGMTLLIAGIMALKISKQTSYYFDISAEGGSGSAVQIGSMTNPGDLTGQGASLSISALPTSETKKMMDELGAIILDFQNLGEHALKKWMPEQGVGKAVESKKSEVQNKDDEVASNEAFFG